MAACLSGKGRCDSDHQERSAVPTRFIGLSAKVNTYGDCDFWGLAFDPDFAINGYVYVTYTFENAAPPTTSALEHRFSPASRPTRLSPTSPSPGTRW